MWVLLVLFCLFLIPLFLISAFAFVIKVQIMAGDYLCRIHRHKIDPKGARCEHCAAWLKGADELTQKCLEKSDELSLVRGSVLMNYTLPIVHVKNEITKMRENGKTYEDTITLGEVWDMLQKEQDSITYENVIKWNKDKN